MNPIDWLVASFDPIAGLKRASARVALRELKSIRDHYEAARMDRSLMDWRTSGADPNALVGPSLEVLRSRSRWLARNNPFVSRAIELLTAKMVGTGVRPRLAEDEPEQVRDRTMDLWKQWVDEADVEGVRDLYGLQRIAVRTVIESGEALIRFVPMPGKVIPWGVRVLEPDYINTQLNNRLENGNTIRLGVEYNQRGTEVAYHMFTYHPGADFFTRRSSGDMTERVPAQSIARIYWSTRPEQTHGVPWTAPIATMAQHLDDLNDARLKRAKIQACYTAFVRKNPDPAVVTTDPITGQRRQQMAAGLIEYLGADEDVTMAVPPQGEGDDEWQIMLLHSIAAGCGTTYSQMTGDLRQANYSSMRAGLIDFWSLLDGWQTLMLRPMMCRPLWRYFDEMAGALNSRKRPLSVEWDFPDRPFVDPVKDGEAIDAALLAGRRSWHEVVQSTGRDPDLLITELKRERQELGSLNLPHVLKQPAAPEGAAVAAPKEPPAGGAEGDGEDEPPTPPNGSGRSQQETMQ